MNVVMPNEVNNILEMYCGLLRNKIPGTVRGVYLYGSLVLHDFKFGSSDIDFITVVNRSLADGEIAILDEIHGMVRKYFPRPPLNGIYVQVQDIGGMEEDIEPIPYYLDGTMHKAGYFEINPVTWFELKEHGVTILGPDISILDFSFDFNTITEYIADNINAYWSNWVGRARNGLSRHSVGLFFSKEMVEWGVLGVTRQYYTLREKDVVSKSKAGEYALLNVPDKWKQIIKEALRIREGVITSNYISPIKRRNDTLSYMDFIIADSKKLLSTKGQ